PLSASVEDMALAPSPTEDALVARALDARPDLAAAREERARLETEANLAARRGRIPNPVLRGFYREEQLQEHIVGGGVSVPLPIFNREQGTQAALLAGAHGAAAEEARLKTQIPRDVHLALAHRRTAEEAWRRYEREALPAATQARDLLERGFDAGYLALPDLLLQQDRLLQVRAGAIDAWPELPVAAADLVEAMGDVARAALGPHEFWVIARVMQIDVPRVDPRAEASFVADAFPGERFAGSVDTGPSYVDPATQTAPVRVRVHDHDGRLRPGMTGAV